MTKVDVNARGQLLHDGYCTFPNVLPAALLERLREVTERLLAAQTEAQAAQFRAQGSMIPIRSIRSLPS